MPSIQFRCPSCQHIFQIDASQKGEQAICSICKIPITVVPLDEELAYEKTEVFAVVSFICSVLGILIFRFFLIPGIVFGHIARARIKRSDGKLGGNAWAIAGLAFSYLGVIHTAIFLYYRLVLYQEKTLLP